VHNPCDTGWGCIVKISISVMLPVTGSFGCLCASTESTLFNQACMQLGKFLLQRMCKPAETSHVPSM